MYTQGAQKSSQIESNRYRNERVARTSPKQTSYQVNYLVHQTRQMLFAIMGSDYVDRDIRRTIRIPHLLESNKYRCEQRIDSKHDDELELSSATFSSKPISLPLCQAALDEHHLTHECLTFTTTSLYHPTPLNLFSFS